MRQAAAGGAPPAMASASLRRAGRPTPVERTQAGDAEPRTAATVPERAL